MLTLEKSILSLAGSNADWTRRA